MPYANTDTGIAVFEKDPNGYATRATLTTGTPATTASLYAVGCDLTVLDTGVHYRNQGTVAAPIWVIN